VVPPCFDQHAWLTKHAAILIHAVTGTPVEILARLSATRRLFPDSQATFSVLFRGRLSAYDLPSLADTAPTPPAPRRYGFVLVSVYRVSVKLSSDPVFSHKPDMYLLHWSIRHNLPDTPMKDLRAILSAPKAQMYILLFPACDPTLP